MDYTNTAAAILRALGENNLVAAAHCATRLRLVLKDDTKIEQKALDENVDVKGTFKLNGQLQIIIGAGDVNFVYDELIKQAHISEATKDEVKEISAQESQSNVIIRFIKLLSDICSILENHGQACRWQYAFLEYLWAVGCSRSAESGDCFQPYVCLWEISGNE